MNFPGTPFSVVTILVVYIYISSLGSYVLTGYVSSKVRNEYRSNTGAVEGSWNLRVALHSNKLNAFEMLSRRN